MPPKVVPFFSRTCIFFFRLVFSFLHFPLFFGACLSFWTHAFVSGLNFFTDLSFFHGLAFSSNSYFFLGLAFFHGFICTFCFHELVSFLELFHLFFCSIYLLTCIFLQTVFYFLSLHEPVSFLRL